MPTLGSRLSSADCSTIVDQFSTTEPGTVPLSPGGTTQFLRADGTWATPVAEAEVFAPFKGNQATGSFTVETGKFALQGKRLELTTIQRATLAGTGRLILLG